MLARGSFFYVRCGKREIEKGSAKYMTDLYWLYQPPEIVVQEFMLLDNMAGGKKNEYVNKEHLKLSVGGKSLPFLDRKQHQDATFSVN